MPTAPRTSLTDQTLQLVESLRPTEHGFTDGSTRTLTILGGRGQGKSTLLADVVGRLDGNVIALPVADPELFHPADDLLTWVLAGLESRLPEATLDRSMVDGSSIRKRLQNLRRDYLLVAGDVSAGLLHRGVAPLEYARDTSRLTPTGMNLARSWMSLTDALSEAVQQPDLLVVLPVDDADLHPTKIADYLAQIQLLGTSKHFMTIMAADEEALLNCLIAGELGEYEQWERLIRLGLADPSRLSEVAARKFTKYFPRQNRIRIIGVTEDAKLDFVPVGSEVSLGNLLENFPIDDGARSIASLFEVRDSENHFVCHNAYTLALSNNRRDLEQLHRALQALVDREETSRVAMETILTHGLESSRYDVPPALWGTTVFVDKNDHRELEVDFTELAFGKTVGGRSRIYNPDEGEFSDGPLMNVYVRKITGFYAVLRDPSEAGDLPERPDSLPPMFSNLLNLAWETVQESSDGTSLVELASVVGRFSSPGLRNWTNALTVDGSQSRYVTPPDWEGFSDYHTYCVGWNHLVDLAFGLDKDSRRESLCDLFIVAHMAMVAEIQASRCLPSWIVNLTSDQLRYPTTPKMVFWDHLEDAKNSIRAMAASLRVTTRDLTQREQDFRSWLEVGLPLLTTRNVCSQMLSEDLRGLWLELSEPGSPGREIVGEHLASEVSSYIEKDRADADIELLTLVDAERGEALRRVRETVGGRLDEERREAILRLREAVSDQSVVDRLESDGAAPEVLISLRVLGINPGALPRIAELFPPRLPISEKQEFEREAQV